MFVVNVFPRVTKISRIRGGLYVSSETRMFKIKLYPTKGVLKYVSGNELKEFLKKSQK